MKFEENAKVISQKKIADGVFDMWIMTSNIAENRPAVLVQTNYDQRSWETADSWETFRCALFFL